MKESSDREQAPLRVEIRGKIPDSIGMISMAIAGLAVSVLSGLAEVLEACKDWLVGAIRSR